MCGETRAYGRAHGAARFYAPRHDRTGPEPCLLTLAASRISIRLKVGPKRCHERYGLTRSKVGAGWAFQQPPYPATTVSWHQVHALGANDVS